MAWKTWEQFADCSLANLGLLRDCYRRGWAYVPVELTGGDYTTLRDARRDNRRATVESCWLLKSWAQLCRAEGWPLCFLLPTSDGWRVEITFREGMVLSVVGVKAVRGFVWSEDTAEGPTCVDVAQVKFTVRQEGHESTVKALLDLVKEHLEDNLDASF